MAGAELRSRWRKLWLFLAAPAVLIVVAAIFASQPPRPPITWKFLNGQKPYDTYRFQSGLLANQQSYGISGPNGDTNAPQNSTLNYYDLPGDFESMVQAVKAEALEHHGQQRPRTRPGGNVLFYGPGWTIVVSREDTLTGESRPGRAYLYTFDTHNENLPGMASRLVPSWLKP